jgi:hypothetical protein
MFPFERKDPLSLAALVGADLIPFIGVFLFDWKIRFIVLLYWIENLIAGFNNILKMVTLKANHAADKTRKNFLKFLFPASITADSMRRSFFL